MESAFLQANSDVYECLIKNINPVSKIDEFERTLCQAASAAQFAGEFHTGRFADGSTENICLEIGFMLTSATLQADDFPRLTIGSNQRRHILHVTCFVLAVGGHTRMLYHWIRNDRSSVHSVVLLNQTEPIPQWFREALAFGGGELIQMPPNLPLCQQALRLIAVARQNVNLVVLHHIWYDVVPTVAFAAQACPPVAVLNHADHVFWLGSSVADMVINLRTAAADHTARRRFISCNTVLPIPLADHPSTRSRSDAREALGIGKNQVVLLSVGRRDKYLPSGQFDYVATASKILDSRKDVHIYIVGESEEGIRPFLRTAIHERLHFVGSLEDPSVYRDAADVYLESFPFGSTTALLEAALSGLPVVPAYAPLSPLLVGTVDAITHLVPNPRNEQEYIERVMSLIAQPSQREQLGHTLRNRVLVDHVGQGWLTQLAKLYNETDHLSHAPAPIPRSQCLFSPEDIGLSLWKVFPRVENISCRKEAVLTHTAFIWKQAGNFRESRRYAWRAIRKNPFQLFRWILLMKSMLGKKGPIIRTMWNSCTELSKNIGSILINDRSS